MALEPYVYCTSVPERVKREHVIPQMLGTFENNWTTDFVCDECNQFLGDHLELPLGRDSLEAIQRLQTSVKKAAEYADLSYRRLTMVVEEDGLFHGAIATLGPDAGIGVQPVPIAQVGFRRPGVGRLTGF
jgi:hypothetical protein